MAYRRKKVYKRRSRRSRVKRAPRRRSMRRSRRPRVRRRRGKRTPKRFASDNKFQRFLVRRPTEIIEAEATQANVYEIQDDAFSFVSLSDEQPLMLQWAKWRIVKVVVSYRPAMIGLQSIMPLQRRVVSYRAEKSDNVLTDANQWYSPLYNDPAGVLKTPELAPNYKVHNLFKGYRSFLPRVMYRQNVINDALAPSIQAESRLVMDKGFHFCDVPMDYATDLFIVFPPIGVQSGAEKFRWEVNTTVYVEMIHRRDFSSLASTMRVVKKAGLSNKLDDILNEAQNTLIELKKEGERNVAPTLGILGGIAGVMSAAKRAREGL